MMPKVSIIVPIYRVEAYLRECIDSVLCQTFSDFELILVDDGSPDCCGEICEEYARQDSRIRVIHKPNGGLSDARNAGLDIACGQYIYFLDSDDTIVQELLETVLPYMEQGCDLVSFSLQSFYDDGTRLEPWKRKAGYHSLKSLEERKQFLHRTLFSNDIGWEAWSRIFSREIIERHHIRFADNRRIFAEDMCFSLCYCAHASQIQCLDVCLYNYRQRRDSIMGQQTGKNTIPKILELADAVENHYQSCEDCKPLLDDFSFLRFQILMSQFIFQIQSVPNPAQFRQEVIASLPNWPEAAALLRQNLNHRQLLRKYYTALQYMEVIQNAEFLLGGSEKKEKFSIWLIQRIRNQGERLDRIGSRWRK